MKKTNVVNPMLLFFAALIWGVAFVAQDAAMDHIGPFTFNAVRSLLGGIVLIPLVLIFDKRAGKRFSILGDGTRAEKMSLLRAGIICGVFLAIGSSLQQIGIQYTSVGKAGFITALYIILVPIVSIFFKKRTGWLLWVSVAIAIVGLYFLCKPEGGEGINKGDIYLVLCAFGFTGHILLIDKYAGHYDPVRLSMLQFFVCGIICAIFMVILEKPVAADIVSAWLPIAYAGIFSCGVAYTVQIIGQKGMNPTVASLILSFESVFAVLAGWIILNQTLSTAEIIGCALMFAAIILAQIPVGAKKKVARNLK